MERNSSGALRAPGAFGARDTSDHHIILSSCSLYITRVCSLAAVLLPSAAAPLTTRPPAAPAPPAPLSADFGRTAVLPNPASLAGDDASAARYTPQRTRASNEALK